MGFLRVEPVGLNQNGRTFSLTLKGHEAAAALAAPIIVSSSDAPGPEGMDARPSEDEVDAASPRRTAFISWAHGDRTWEKTIARFASQLRAFGVNADVDLFHLNDDDVIWANYGGQAIQANEFVLIAVSGPYKERWEGTNDGRVGAGAAREANVMKGLFDDNQHDFFRKVKIVVLPGSTVADIPAELRASAQRFEIHTLDLDGLEELLRTLTGQAAYVPPPIGTVPILPPRFIPETGPNGPSIEDVRSRLEELQRTSEAAPVGDNVAHENLDAERTTAEAAIEAMTEAAASAGSQQALTVGTRVRVMFGLGLVSAKVTSIKHGLAGQVEVELENGETIVVAADQIEPDSD